MKELEGSVEIFPVTVTKKEKDENVIPGQHRRSVIIAGAVKGDDRLGPFEVVQDVKIVKVVPLIKSGDKIV